MQNENTIVVRVADFTVVPGARHRDDGDGSAQQFFEDVFKPAVDATENADKYICIDFDGTWGYASSFISELAKDIKLTYGADFINSRLQTKSDDDGMLTERFRAELEKDYEA